MKQKNSWGRVEKLRIISADLKEKEGGERLPSAGKQRKVRKRRKCGETNNNAQAVPKAHRKVSY